jgi:hypothetical protein
MRCGPAGGQPTSRQTLLGKSFPNCSGLQTVARGLANRGGFQLTCAADTPACQPTITANEPTFRANSPLNPPSLRRSSRLPWRGMRVISRPCPGGNGPECPGKNGPYSRFHGAGPSHGKRTISVRIHAGPAFRRTVMAHRSSVPCQARQDILLHARLIGWYSGVLHFSSS